MKVRMLVALVILGKLRQVGDPIELEPAVAELLITRGHAKPDEAKTKARKAADDGPTV